MHTWWGEREREKEGENQQAHEILYLKCANMLLFISPQLESESLNKGTRVKVLLYSSGSVNENSEESERYR